jgi:glycosyltransferase involved in cell wall biosynthesis
MAALILWVPLRLSRCHNHCSGLFKFQCNRPCEYVLIPRRPKVLAIVPSYIASCQIGVIKPLSALAARREIQLEVKLETKASVTAIHSADLVVFCRNTEPSYAYLLNEAVSTNKPIIYDLDDNFWDVPFETDPELARYHRLPLRIQQLEKYLQHSTLVRVYSPVMRELVTRLNSQVLLLKAGFDFSLLPHQSKSRDSRDKVKVVYATSRTVDNQYKLFAEGMTRAIEKFGDAVEFTIWGCSPGDLVGHKGIKILPLVGDYEDFLNRFARSGFDVGLAPMEDTAFYRSKTNTKLRDYGACRVAGIYSDVEVYSSCVENGQTGLLVPNTPDGWFNAISSMIEKPELRTQIQNSAYQKVYDEYRQQVIEEEWLSQINTILAGDTSYSLANNPLRQVTEVLIRADQDNLHGFTFPAQSPGEGYPVPKLFLEIFTPEKSLLREASATFQKRVEDSGTVQFNFKPIRNSRSREFILRFISIQENQAEKASLQWLPTTGFIHMLYDKSVQNNPASIADTSAAEVAFAT